MKNLQLKKKNYSNNSKVQLIKCEWKQNLILSVIVCFKDSLASKVTSKIETS